MDRRLEQLVQKQSWKLKEPSKQSVIKVRQACSLGFQGATQDQWAGLVTTLKIVLTAMAACCAGLWLFHTTIPTLAVFHSVPAGAAHVQPL